MGWQGKRGLAWSCGVSWQRLLKVTYSFHVVSLHEQDCCVAADGTQDMGPSCPVTTCIFSQPVPE